MKSLNEGEVIFVQGSGKKPYEIKMSGGVVSCSCPAWRNQSLSIDQRTCKHIKANVSNGAAASVQSGSMVNGTAPAPKPAKGPKNVPPCLLAHSWDGESDVSGWLASPKFDGVRAWWDGEKFWSRLGNEFHAPQWFKDQMPKGIVLDGELFAGNGRFQETVSFVKKFVPVDEEWQKIKFMVFDLPAHGGTYENRIEAMATIALSATKYLEVVKVSLVPLTKDVLSVLKTAEEAGYEGIMLRQPRSLYEEGRSHTLLKVKSFKDCEVTVVGYEDGKGKHKGRVGAINVRMDNGVEFNVGTGLSDAERENPPSIGSKITVRYQELSKDNVPRFPSYLRKHEEM